MKAIFTLLLSSLITLSAFAYDNSRLSITTVKKANSIQVEVDGRKYQMKDNTITLRDLSTGRHTVKIYREIKRNNRGWSLGNRQEVIYSGTVYLKQDFHLDITINRFGKALVDEQRINRNERDEDGWYDEDPDYGRDNDRDRVMNDREFSQAKETLRRENFESTRMTMAKQMIVSNLFTSYQVRELLQLFSFESNKLELAKYAYTRTTDKRSYHVVNDVFAHSSSKEELARYIRSL